MTTDLAPAPATPDEAASHESQASAPEGDRRSLQLVALCFFFSGMAALLYQTAWMRQFAAVFGTSEPAVAAVLAAYMSGLAIGAAAAGKWLTKVKRPVLVYGLLELGIAMGAIALPLGLYLARTLFKSMTGGLPEPPDAGGAGQFAFYLAATFLLVLIPTSFMGATLPLLARHAVNRESQIGERIGFLYAINTVGAVFGTIFAAFVLLPRIGLQATVWVGVALNAFVFVLALMLAQGAKRESAEDSDESRAVPCGWSFIFPIMACSGAVAFTYEVLWTRLFSHILGGSIYAFATMLASFLSGIAIGSAIASKHARTKEDALRGFGAAQLGVGLFSVAIYFALDLLPGFQTRIGAGESGGILQNAAIAAMMLLPSTLCLGATFPFAVRIATQSANQAGHASARVFSWNTLGGTIGALAAGFLIVPALQYEGTIRLCILANFSLAVFAFFAAKSSELKPRVLGLATLVLAAVFFWPAPPTAILSASPFTTLSGQGDPLWIRAGSSCTTMVTKLGDEYQVRVNGLPQSYIVPKGAPPFYGRFSRWLAALPLFARPEAEQVCVIGLGGGVAVEDLPDSVRQIDVFELSREVVEANEYLSELRRSDPLADPRVRIIENDARSAFERTTKRWDVVVSQPSHPWTAGASHLFTKEFAALVHEHLTDDGVFMQWAATMAFDLNLIRYYGATLLNEFEHVMLYQQSNNTPLFLASDSELDIAKAMLDNPGLLASAPQYSSWLGVGLPEDFAAQLTFDTEDLRALCEGTEPNSDDLNRLALRPPSWTGLDHVESVGARMEEIVSPLVHYDDLDPRLDRISIIRRLLDYELVDRARTLTAHFDEESQRLYAESLINRRLGEIAAANEKLHRAADLAPSDPVIAKSLLLTELGRELSERGARAEAVLDDVGLAVVDGWHAMIAEDWEGLAKLDATLDEVQRADPLYFLSVQLRSLWRAHVERPEPEARALAHDAIVIVDDAIAIGPNTASLSFRIQAGVRADRPDIVIESTSLLIQLLERQPLTSANARHIGRALEQLTTLENDERVDKNRVQTLSLALQLLKQPRMTNMLLEGE